MEGILLHSGGIFHDLRCAMRIHRPESGGGGEGGTRFLEDKEMHADGHVTACRTIEEGTTGSTFQRSAAVATLSNLMHQLHPSSVASWEIQGDGVRLLTTASSLQGSKEAVLHQLQTG